MTELDAVLQAILSFGRARGLEGSFEDLDRPGGRISPSDALRQEHGFNGTWRPLDETVRATQAKGAGYAQKRLPVDLVPNLEARPKPFADKVTVASLPAPVLPGVAAGRASEAAKAQIAVFQVVTALEASGSIVAEEQTIRALEVIRHSRRDEKEEDYKATRRGGSAGASHHKASLTSQSNHGGVLGPPRLPGRASLPARAALAAGASPAVLKVISSIHCTGAGALLEYMGTREKKADKEGKQDTASDRGAAREDIPVYTQDGRTLMSKAERAFEVAEWQKEFRDGYNLTGVFTYEITLSGASDVSLVKAALDGVFENKPFLYKLEGNRLHVIGLSRADPRATNAELQKMRNKGSGADAADPKTLTKEQIRISRGFSALGLSVDVEISAAAAKDSSSDYALEKFIRQHGHVRNEQGQEIVTGSNPKLLATGIRKSWAPHMRVRYPVNAYHVVFTARAGTDPLAVIEATKSFLDEAVQDRKWMISHHPDTAHVHVHAMIAARNATGKPLRITKDTLRQWRSIYAEKAREQGVALVAVNRRETASTRPYNQRQLATVMRAALSSRPEKYPYAASLKEAIEQKRSGACVAAQSVAGSEALKIWSEVALETQARFPAIARAARGFEKALRGQIEPHVPLSELQNLSHNIIRQSFTLIRAEISNMALIPQEFEKRENALKKSVTELGKLLPAECSQQVTAIRSSMEVLLDEVRPKAAGKQQVVVTRSAGSGTSVRTQLDIAAEAKRLRDVVDPELDKVVAFRKQKAETAERERAIREQHLKAQKEAELKAQQAKDTRLAASDRESEQGR